MLSLYIVCVSMNTFIQVLYGLIEVLTEVLTVLQCSFMNPYTNSQIYSLRNIFLMASRFPHRSGPSYTPVCIPVYALGLTDQSQPIRSSACSIDSADVELISQHIGFIYQVFCKRLFPSCSGQDCARNFRVFHGNGRSITHCCDERFP